MTKPTKQHSKDQQAKPKRKRGRPEKLVKIDDTPRNVARAFFGIRSSKYARPR